MNTSAGATGTGGNSDDQAAKRLLFLSYTRTEIAHARRVIQFLEQAGYDVWWDGKLTGGETYIRTTEAALQNADCVVVLWSKTSVESDWVRDEAQYGREHGKLVPLSLDGTMAPLGFRQVQLIDISSWNGKAGDPLAQQILAAIELRCGNSDALPSTTIAPAPLSPPSGGLPLSRRAAIATGAALAGLTAFGTWRMMSGPTATQGKVSMAVLPFTNLTGDEDQSWFSVGLSNELRTVLTRNPRLLVSAPTSSAMNDDRDDFAVGAALGVNHVLRGSVQLVAETVRISAELAQIDNGLVRWSESFDREFADVLAVQSEIAESVARSLVAQVANADETERSLDEQNGIGGTESIVAYEAYLRGIAFSELSSGIESDRAAVAQFEAAIEADPNYASAHSMRATRLASVANATADADAVSKLYDQSIEAAEVAIAIEPKLASAHVALGFAYNHGRLNRKAAYPHYRRAQELAPGDADTMRGIAIFYAYGDQHSRAEELVNQALVLDPLNARAFRTAGFVALFARDYPKAIDRMNSALSLNPSISSAYFVIANAQYMLGNYADALRAFETEPVALFSQIGVAITQEKLGDKDAAQQAFDAMLEDYGDASLYQQAQVYAQWGDREQALRLLERAFAEADPGVLFAPNDPLLDPIRGEPGILPLLDRLSL